MRPAATTLVVFGPGHSPTAVGTRPRARRGSVIVSEDRSPTLKEALHDRPWHPSHFAAGASSSDLLSFAYTFLELTVSLFSGDFESGDLTRWSASVP